MKGLLHMFHLAETSHISQSFPATLGSSRGTLHNELLAYVLFHIFCEVGFYFQLSTRYIKLYYFITHNKHEKRWLERKTSHRDTRKL